MNLFKFLGTGATDTTGNQLPELFPLGILADTFSSADIVTTYQKILTDVMERTHGLSPAKQEPLLWDNFLQSESGEGLVTLLAKAMAEMSELFVVYIPSTDVLRRADADEERAIKHDTEKPAEPKQLGTGKTGVWLSFKGYRRTEMLRVYSALEYCVLGSLNKSMNLAKAVQLKINDLRASTALADADVAKSQMIAIAKALSNGRDVGLDAKDTIEIPTVDMSPTEKAMAFIEAKKAWVLSMPVSYGGEQTSGIGSTGEADMRAVERGLKQYFVSIARPALKAIFGVQTTFKSQDFRQTTAALETLEKLDVASDQILPLSRKIEIVARMFDLDPKVIEAELAEEKRRRPELAAPVAVAAEGAPRVSQ